MVWCLRGVRGYWCILFSHIVASRWYIGSSIESYHNYVSTMEAQLLLKWFHSVDNSYERLVSLPECKLQAQWEIYRIQSAPSWYSVYIRKSDRHWKRPVVWISSLVTLKSTGAAWRRTLGPFNISRADILNAFTLMSLKPELPSHLIISVTTYQPN